MKINSKLINYIITLIYGLGILILGGFALAKLVYWCFQVITGEKTLEVSSIIIAFLLSVCILILGYCLIKTAKHLRPK